MITVEDKIRAFSKYVYDKQVKNSNNMIKDIEEKNMLALEAKQRELEDKYNSVIEKTLIKTEIESQKIISSAKIEAKNSILNLKGNLLSQLNGEILQSFNDYVNDHEYISYIDKLLEDSEDFLLQSRVKIFLVERDVKKFESKIKVKYPNAEILTIGDENIGGFIIESISTNERVDQTILRKVNEWKNEIGIRLYEALEE
ncbi:vacuolar-type H+-ATPase subunit E/Vma4 [Alkalibaculum bacchi]|uniref:Vacuolar-type H+-ATPase subunit E/Vma4 n=1 Tax=Alkalibaculum bacchi TaxID=645887 RepID=A0A366I605_9FIRM|nr:V-type ATP synthase subunit E family protein [Alkalibaculum bacchi]RBP63902.1 vacuolar-type H+-ATPase subunit E/Vma4 [Alkalibaculum bacchi]